MSPVELVLIGLTALFIFRRLFGPHWMRSRWREHVQKMQSLAQEMQTFAAQHQAPSAHSAAPAKCADCGAPAGESAKSWPNGDTRCEHCGNWSNRRPH